MKKILYLVLLAVITSTFAHAQKRPVMPEQGYWVVESNTAHLKNSTVYFYTSDHILFYKESVTGKKVNVKKRKVVKQLNKVFQDALVAWNHGQVVKENKMLVWNRLR